MFSHFLLFLFLLQFNHQRSVPKPCFLSTQRVIKHMSLILFYFFPDMSRHPSTDSTPSDSGSSPSDSCSSPSPSTPQKLLPACTSPFGPRIFPASPRSSGSPRPQPEGSDHRNNTTRLSGKLGGHGPCGHHVPIKMERIKVCVYILACLQFTTYMLNCCFLVLCQLPYVCLLVLSGPDGF